MFRRILKILIRVLIILVVVIVLAVAILGWRLSSGPLDVSFLTPKLEDFFAQSVTGYNVVVEAATLVWDREDDILGVRAREITFYDVAGDSLAGVPFIDVQLGFSALLDGVIAVTAVRIEGAWLRIVRGADGHIRLSLAADADAAPEQPRAVESAPPDTATVAAATAAVTVAAAVDTTAGSDLAAVPFFDQIMAPPDRDNPLTYLDRVDLTGARFMMVDEGLEVTWQANDVDCRLERSAAGLAGQLSFDVPLTTKIVRIETSLNHDRDHRDTSLAVSFAELFLVDLGELLGIDFLQRIDVVGDGTADLTVDSSGKVSDFGFAINGVTVPASGAPR